MAEIVFVTPGGASPPVSEPPSALQLLSHRITPVTGGDRAAPLAAHSELAIVDARTDPAAARTTCQLLDSVSGQWPVLLLIRPAGLPALGAGWPVDDFVLADALPAEFDARIRLLVHSAATAALLSAGPVVIDEDAYVATAGGRQLDLTYTEFELLKYLVANPGRVLTREQLLSEVWGYDYFGGTRTVDVHIRRLRAKLGPEHDHCISTVRNVGYRLATGR